MRTTARLLISLVTVFAASAQAEIPKPAGKATTNKIVGPDPDRLIVKVSSSDGQRYDEIQGRDKRLTGWASVSCKKGKENGFPDAYLQLGNQTIAKDENMAGDAWRSFEIDVPAKFPSDPVAVCNGELQRRASDAASRSRLIQRGFNVKLDDAYDLSVTQSCTIDGGKDGLFDKPDRVGAVSTAKAIDLQVSCSPRPRATSAGGPPVVTPADAVQSVKFTASPMAKELVNGQLCPTKLRLLGEISYGGETFQGWRGKSVFFGSGYLSRIQEVSWNAAGQQTVHQARDIDWDTPASSGMVLTAPGAAPSGPREKTLSMTFNVTNGQDEVVKSSGSQRFVVKCELPRTPPSGPAETLSSTPPRPAGKSLVGSTDLQRTPPEPRVRPGPGPVRPNRTSR